MIVKTMGFSDFWDWLQSSSDYKDGFSYEGAQALFEYLDGLSENWTGGMEFDPIAWCGQYSEYENFDDFRAEREHAAAEDIDSIGDLEQHTLVISETPLVIEDF